MLQLRTYAASLPFQYPFRIAKGTKTEQPALLVSLGFGRLQGWGEAPAIPYYDVTVEGMLESLERARPVIERYSLMDPQRFWHFLHHLLPGQHFLTAALDIAAWICSRNCADNHSSRHLDFQTLARRQATTRSASTARR